MLTSLSIRDVVLIDRLDLAFGDGLSVLTGETGAGKSILLDALGLALGARAEARLVRQGCEQASVAAAFDLPADHPIHTLLADRGIGTEDGLILRRVLGADGRSRAFVNDQPVNVSLLRALGEQLVEVHGQFETQGLLNPITHRAILDAFAGNESRLRATTTAFEAWRAARNARAQAEVDLEAARIEEDYLRHVTDELDKLAPQPGEADALAAERTRMMGGEKIADSLKDALNVLVKGKGVDGALRGALRILERNADKTIGDSLTDILGTLDRAAEEAAEGINLLERTIAALDLDPRHLEGVEERLFALKAACRKHGVDPDQLADLRAEFRRQIAALDDGGANLDRLRAQETKARADFTSAATALSEARQAAAAAMDAAVAHELPPLKLERASFVTSVTPLNDAQWTADGADQVEFRVTTNPGAPAGPLNKIASGGELARFMLALKVVLAQADPVPTLVFDEVDSGIGGAVAAAVGDRLARLGQEVQVMVVTHSPQVAAQDAHHWRVVKTITPAGTVSTTVIDLDADDRKEEVARMLSGETITAEARAAADSLLGHQNQGTA